MFGLELGSVIAIGIGLTVTIMQVYLMISLYRKCPPNQAMIVSGMYAGTDGIPYKILVGGAAVVLPVIQQVSYLSLEVKSSKMQSKVPMFTDDGMPLLLSFASQYKVNGDVKSIATAAELMLGKTAEEIDALVSDVLLGFIRHIVSGITSARVKRGFDEYLPEISGMMVEKLGIACVALSVEEYVELDLDLAQAAAFDRWSEQPTSFPSILESSPRQKAIAEYERAMPILEKEVGEQSLVFKDSLLRYADLLAQEDDFLSREKADQIRVRANKIDAVVVS